MANAKLDASVRRIVRQHGLGNVLAALAQVADGDGLKGAAVAASVNGGGKPAAPSKASANGGAKPAATRAGKPARPKPTAVAYVAKMDLPEDKRRALAELAERFDGKRFMPSFGDVWIFCQNHKIEIPASRTRASALPRVFKFLAGMDTSRLERMLHLEMYSGPSDLGPIADAIRRNGREAQAAGRAAPGALGAGQAPVRARASARRAATSAGDSASA